MSLEHIPKIDFAGVVTDTFDADHASINASEYSKSAENQSLINTLVKIIAVYISDNIATDKNCLIQLSKVLYDANYKLLYKLSQDENFIDKLRQKLVITDSSASSKPALTSVDFDRMKNTIVNQVKAAIKDAVKKNKSETDRQINDVAKAFNADKDKPATSSSNVKIPDTTPEQNTVETDDGTIDFNKLEPILLNTQLTPVWLTSRSAITNNLRKLNINASNRTIALLTVAFKKTTVQAAIDTLTGTIDQNAKAIHRTSAAALTATTVGATAGSMIGRAHKPSVFSKTSSFALGAKSALSKVGSVATSFFKGLFTVTKHIIVGLYKITKTILVSIAKLTKAVLVTVGRAIKFTFVTLPMTVFSGIKRIGKFINEKVLNTSIVKGIVGFLLSPAIVYIVGFIAGFITEKIKQAGGVRALLSNFFTGVKNRIVEGIKTAIDVVWAGIKKPGEVISGLKDKLRKKIEEKLKATEKEGVENPENTGKDSPISDFKKFVKTKIKEAKPVEAIKAIWIQTHAHLHEKAEEDKNNGKRTWKESIWVFLDDLCHGIEKLATIIKTAYDGIKDISKAVYDKSVEIITSITAPFTSDFNKKLNDELKKKETSLASATEEEKLAAAKDLAIAEGLFENYFSDKHNPLSVKKLRDLYSADKLNISIGDKLGQIKTWFDEKLDPIMSIVKVAIKLSNSRIAKFAFSCMELLKDDEWIMGIPDPLVKLIAGAVMLTIRGIIAAFRWRKKTQFELGENFKHKFGISIDKAAKESHKKIDHLFNTYKLTPENLEEFRNKKILLDTDISEVEDPNTKERKLIINVENIKDRLHLFVETLKSENIKLDDFTKEITTKENGRTLLAEYLNDKASNTLPKLVADSILSFPLIGISKPIELNREVTGSDIYEYNRKLIYMLNLKRGILKKLSDNVLGELSGSSTIKNFSKLLVYASPKYLNKIQDIFKLPTNLTDDNKKMSSELLNLDTIIARQEFKLFDYDPMKSIKTGVRDAQDLRLIHDHKTEGDYRKNSGDYHATLGSGSSLFVLAVRGISNSNLDEISKLNLLTTEEAAQVKNFQREKLNSGADIAEVLSPTNNDEAYIVKSAEDVLAVMLSQSGISETRINEIIVEYKARSKNHENLYYLTKKLYKALVISNDKIESQADHDAAARSAK